MWKQDANGKEMNQPIKDYDHLMDSIAYAIQILDKGTVKVLNKSALRL